MHRIDGQAAAQAVIILRRAIIIFAPLQDGGFDFFQLHHQLLIGCAGFQFRETVGEHLDIANHPRGIRGGGGMRHAGFAFDHGEMGQFFMIAIAGGNIGQTLCNIVPFLHCRSDIRLCSLHIFREAPKLIVGKEKSDRRNDQ